MGNLHPILKSMNIVTDETLWNKTSRTLIDANGDQLHSTLDNSFYSIHTSPLEVAKEGKLTYYLRIDNSGEVFSYYGENGTERLNNIILASIGVSEENITSLNKGEETDSVLLMVDDLLNLDKGATIQNLDALFPVRDTSISSYSTVRDTLGIWEKGSSTNGSISHHSSPTSYPDETIFEGWEEDKKRNKQVWRRVVAPTYLAVIGSGLWTSFIAYSKIELTWLFGKTLLDVSFLAILLLPILAMYGLAGLYMWATLREVSYFPSYYGQVGVLLGTSFLVGSLGGVPIMGFALDFQWSSITVALLTAIVYGWTPTLMLDSLSTIKAGI